MVPDVPLERDDDDAAAPGTPKSGALRMRRGEATHRELIAQLLPVTKPVQEPAHVLIITRGLSFYETQCGRTGCAHLTPTVCRDGERRPKACGQGDRYLVPLAPNFFVLFEDVPFDDGRAEYCSSPGRFQTPSCHTRPPKPDGLPPRQHKVLES
jgi:hypothetical protein